MTALATEERVGSWGEARAELDGIAAKRLLILPEVAVPAGGVAVGGSAWAPVAGATAAEVDHAGVDVGPSDTTVLRSVTSTAQSGGWVIAIPDGFLVRRLHLGGLKVGDDALAGAGDLSGDRRLVVALPNVQGGGFGPPVHAVPSLGSKGALPPSLRGASFAQGVLSVPDLDAAKVLVTVTQGERPEDFAPVAGAALGDVTAELVPLAEDLTVTDSTGATAWTRPGPLTDAASGDTTTVAQRLLSAALGKNQPLQTGFTLKTKKPVSLGLSVAAPRGRLVRAVPGTVKVVLEGDPVRLDLGDGAEPLASERPGSVSAILTFHYAGIRLLETIADVLPAGPAQGVVVGADPVRRDLPPQALAGADVARIGVIGLAPVDASLSAELVDAATGKPLGPPAVTKVEAATTPHPATVWLAFKTPQRVTGAVTITLSATTGRFLWASGPSPAMAAAGAVPLVRLAVADPDPGHRPIRLAGAELVRLPVPAAPQGGLPQPASLPPAAFTGPALPLLDSALFATVELSSLTLRYLR